MWISNLGILVFFMKRKPLIPIAEQMYRAGIWEMPKPRPNLLENRGIVSWGGSSWADIKPDQGPWDKLDEILKDYPHKDVNISGDLAKDLPIAHKGFNHIHSAEFSLNFPVDIGDEIRIKVDYDEEASGIYRIIALNRTEHGNECKLKWLRKDE